MYAHLHDRYDGRSHLPDKGLFGLKSNIAQRITKEEEEFEDMLEEERYLSLNKDIMEEDLMKGGMYSDSLYSIRYIHGCIMYVVIHVC